MKRTAILIPRKFQPTMNFYGYIYITTNLVNHKQYIGQHIGKPDSYIGSGVILLKSIEKYGKLNFVSEPIDWAESKEELNQKEIWWIEFLRCLESNSWYNLVRGGEGVGSAENHPLYGKRGNQCYQYGRPLTEETKRKISQTLKSNGKVAGSNNPNYGKPMSDEQKQKLRENCKNNPNYGMRGKRHSDETKQKISRNNGMIHNESAKEVARQRMLTNNPVRFGKDASRARKLYQYTIDGKFVRQYDYIAESQNYGYNLVAVRNCLAGNQKQHQGYVFSYSAPDSESS